jgi:uncharacterized protein
MNFSNLIGHPFFLATFGGLLIGLASWSLLASIGRVAGISGIVAGMLVPEKNSTASEWLWRFAFVLGLVIAGATAAALFQTPSIATRPYPILMIAGLLVGFGTVLGSGCTSGHGVCGLGRKSARSLVATITFMGAGALTVLLIKLLNT